MSRRNYRGLPGAGGLQARNAKSHTFPIAISLVDPVLPLDAKALLDIIQVRCVKSQASCLHSDRSSFRQENNSGKKEQLREHVDEVCGALDAPSDSNYQADVEQPSVLACHTCPGIDDQTIFSDRVIENIGKKGG
jgi:hypothetical protein